MTIPDCDVWQKVSFIYHQIAFFSETNDFNKDSEIYDLSLKIDNSSVPSLDFTEYSNAFLSGGYKAYGSNQLPIRFDSNKPNVYLERLVKSNEIASYYIAYMVTEICSDLNFIRKPSEHYSELMQQYIRLYGLDNVEYAVEMLQLEMKLPLLQEMGLEKRSENQYECEWSAPGGMRVTWFRNAEHLPAGEYLASVLMRFSCRLTEKEAPELGERVFYGPDSLITYFEGSAYLIECKDIEKAEEMVHNLKSSMIQ